MAHLSIVFEYNGSDHATVTYEEILPIKGLLDIANEIARINEADVSDITMRFALKGESHAHCTKAQTTD